jgi:hypothetical protein
VDPAEILAPWVASLREQIPGVALFDAHTHLGEHDPDGMRQSVDELLGGLRDADARGCFVFPMHEPDGYPPANDMVLAAAARSDGLLVPFCRVNPDDGAVAEAARSPPAPAGSSSTRGPRGSRSIIPTSAGSSRWWTSAACRC